MSIQTIKATFLKTIQVILLLRTKKSKYSKTNFPNQIAKIRLSNKVNLTFKMIIIHINRKIKQNFEKYEY